MPSSVPRIDLQQTPQGALVVVLGAWTAADLTAKDDWQALTTQLNGLDKSGDAAWDLRQMDRLDHLGAQLLWTRWGGAWPKHLEVQSGQREMLETVARLTVPLAPAPPPDWMQPVRVLGSRLLSLFDHLKSLMRLIGQLLLDLMRLVRHPQEAPWRDFSGHLYHIGATALPITALVGFLIGVVLAYLISQQLKQ